MIEGTDRVAYALHAATRFEAMHALGLRRPVLGLADVARLVRHLEVLDEPRQPLRLALLRTYTTELLRSSWKLEALLHGFDLTLYEAPYGTTFQEAEVGSGLRGHDPHVTYLFLRWEDLSRWLSSPLPVEVEERRALADDALMYLRWLLSNLRSAVKGLLIVTLLPDFFPPALGMHDGMASNSQARFRGEFKGRLADLLRMEIPSAYFHDLDELAYELGRAQWLDYRLWLASRAPFSVAGAQAVVRRLMAYPVALMQPKAKCLVLDADNTLWGGIIGEDGPLGIALGPDYPGLAYITFQRRLLDLQQRGLLLTLCSKNNPADVSEVLANHPHQILREKHFAAMRVNWESKVENLRSIAQELNLGLEAFVFIDESPHECMAVGQQLPQVTVVQLPERLIDLPFCLDDLPRLEMLELTDEDRRRTVLYVQERQRRQRMSEGQSAEDYLDSLAMKMTICFDDDRHIDRIAQLTQKTNQFNLTTRRYTGVEIRRMLDDPDWLVAHFSLADVFGYSGIVGLALVRGLMVSVVEFDTLLMSCRVIGRRAESAFLSSLLEILRARGVVRVQGTYRASAKNRLVEDFWPRHGFRPIGDGLFELDLDGVLPAALLGIPINIIYSGCDLYHTADVGNRA